MRVKEESLICEPNMTRKKYNLQKNNNKIVENKVEKVEKKTERCLATGLHVWLGTAFI